MKRFTHLEFGDSSDSQRPSGNGESIRDEAFFQTRALQCFLHSDFELALRNYSRALEVNSSFFDGWAGQIWMLIELGEYPEAMIWADKALESFPEHPELFAAKAVASLRDAKFDQAKAFSDNSISKDNIGPRVWLARAEVLLQSKSRVADTCLSKAFSLGTEDAKLVKLEAGRILKQYGRYSTAVEYLQEAVRLFPKSALAWYELGTCQSRLGFTQAVTSLEQCLHLHPDYAEAKEALNKTGRGFFGRLFRRLGLG